MKSGLIVVLLLLFAFLPQTVHTTVTNFNPPNNVVVNGDFSNAKVVHINDILNLSNSNLASFGYWSITAFRYDTFKGTTVPADVNYSIGTVDGRNAIILTVGNGTMLLLWQSLYHTKVNSTTHYHFALDYLDDPSSIQPDISYGQFSPVAARIPLYS